MKKKLHNPIVIDNVFFLGKGEVVSSNLTSSTIIPNTILFIFRALWRLLIRIISCIFAVLLVLFMFGYALQTQDLRLHDTNPTQGDSKWIPRYDMIKPYTPKALPIRWG